MEFSDGLGGTAKLDHSLSIIDINVFAKYFITEGFALEAGLGYGIVASSSAELDGTKVEGVEDPESATLFGLGASYDLESGLGFGFRWNSRLYDQSYSNMQIGVTYKF